MPRRSETKCSRTFRDPGTLCGKRILKGIFCILLLICIALYFANASLDGT